MRFAEKRGTTFSANIFRFNCDSQYNIETLSFVKVANKLYAGICVTPYKVGVVKHCSVYRFCGKL